MIEWDGVCISQMGDTVGRPYKQRPFNAGRLNAGEKCGLGIKRPGRRYATARRHGMPCPPPHVNRILCPIAADQSPLASAVDPAPGI